MRVLAVDVQTDDGVANSALREYADRLDELYQLPRSHALRGNAYLRAVCTHLSVATSRMHSHAERGNEVMEDYEQTKLNLTVLIF